MALTYPYAVADFADRVTAIAPSIKFDLQRNDEQSGSGDGRYWVAELAPPLWTATIGLKGLKANDGRRMAALMRALGANGTFLLYDPRACYPISDPGGAVLGSATVIVASIGSDRLSLGLAGLPSAYALSVGDRIQIDYLSGKIGYHDVVGEAAADASGIIAALPVYPALASAIVPGDVVTLIKPCCKMMMVPGSVDPGTWSDGLDGGAGFTAIQKR